jgi:hypothetical protein
MTKLSKEYLEEIVSEFGRLIDCAYSEDFCWDADVGNMFTPLQFAESCDNSGPDNPRALINNLYRDADEAADHLAQVIDEQNAQRDEDNQIDRDLSSLPDDILRNIAIDAKEALEDMS